MTMILIMTILFLGGLAAWLFETWNKNLPRWISVGSCAIAGLFLIPLTLTSGGESIVMAGVSSTWIEHVEVAWIPRFGINFYA